MRLMTDAEITRTRNLAEAINDAVRKTVTSFVNCSQDEIRHGLAAAVVSLVSYETMQEFLEILAASADAKERVRAIEAGEVADVH